MVKNHLKSVKDITAPLNWQSSPDSPSTQLAYVTQDEIDMMVDANIHGSMDGKPNVGPKGILSLDGGDPITKKEQKRVQRSQTNVNTSSGQDSRQRFRDRTGSNVVTEKEKKARERQGRAPADTSAPSKGMSDEKFEKKWGVTKAQTKGGPGRTIPKAKIEKDWGAEKKKKLFEQEKANWEKLKKKVSAFKFPTLGMGVIGSLQGFGATDRFFKNLQASNQGANLSSRDLVTLVNLMQRSGENPLKFLENYAEKNDLSEAETRDLAAKFNRAYSELGSKVHSSGIMNYLDTKPEGFKDSLSAMFGQYEGDQVPGAIWSIAKKEKGPEKYSNQEMYEKYMKYYEETDNPADKEYYLSEAQYYLDREEGMVDRPTLEDVTDKLGTEGLEYLKATNPSLYYLHLRQPQTQGDLEDLAQLSMPTGENRNSPENKRLSYEIQQARDAVFEQADRADQMSGRAATDREYWTPPGTTPPDTTPPDTTPPEDDQWMTADAGQIGYYNPEINPATGMPWGYQWGTTSEFNPYAEVNLNYPFAARDGGIIGLYNGGYLNNSNGVIGLDGGGYLDDYKAADSLMFKDPQEDEEWEYNV